MSKRKTTAALDPLTLAPAPLVFTGTIANDPRGRVWDVGAEVDRADFTDEEWAWMIAHDAVSVSAPDGGALDLSDGVDAVEASLAARALAARRRGE